MKELNQLVSEKINEMCIDGTLESMVKVEAESLLKELIRRSLDTHSPFGKAIKDKLDKSVLDSVANVEFGEYNRFIAEFVVAEYESILNTTALQQIKNMIGDRLSVAPKEMTVNEFVEGIKNAAQSFSSFDDENLMIEWDERSNYEVIVITIGDTMVTLYRWNRDKGHHIGYITNGERVLTGPVINSTHAHGLELYLYRLYCAGTQVISLESIFGDDIYLFDEEF